MIVNLLEMPKNDIADTRVNGSPINPNKNAPQVGHPTPNALIPDPINPRNPFPVILLCNLNLNKIIESNIPDNAEVAKMEATLKVIKVGPDIIMDVHKLLCATLATKK